MAAKTHFGMRVTPDIKEAILKAADHYQMTATDICVAILTEKLEQTGFMEKADGSSPTGKS